MRCLLQGVLLATCLSVGTVTVQAHEDCDVGCTDEACAEGVEVNYGPRSCTSRGTLLQWSYGTSFSGGPPGADEPLVTDRPDFTEASVTVGRGVVQLEAGYTYVYNNSAGEQEIGQSYPEALWRIGMLAEWFEFRIAWTYASQRLDGVQESGGEDLYLGAKIALTPQERILPEMAIIPQMTVPTGASAFSANEVLAGLNWIYAWEVCDCISTAGSTQFNRAIEDFDILLGTESYHEIAQSWTVAYSLSDQLGAYTEWFAFFPTGANQAQNEHYFNGGFTVLLSNDIQWDIRAGVGLNKAAEDYFVGTGLSLRYGR